MKILFMPMYDYVILFNQHNFLLSQDGEKKVTTSKRSLKPKWRPSDPDAELREFESLSTRRPLILRKACRQMKANIGKNVSERLKGTFEPPVVMASENTLPTASSHISEQRSAVVAVLCCETLKPVCKREENVDPVSLAAAPGPTSPFVPSEGAEEKSADCSVEETGPPEEMHISLYEHSYSRPDIDKNEMWNRILGLHAKILELDRREKNNVAKIQALENEIFLLKKDGAFFREKQKILEDYISSVVL